MNKELSNLLMLDDKGQSDWMDRFLDRYNIHSGTCIRDVFQKKVFDLCSFCREASYFCRLNSMPKRTIKFFENVEKEVYEIVEKNKSI